MSCPSLSTLLGTPVHLLVKDLTAGSQGLNWTVAARCDECGLSGDLQTVQAAAAGGGGGGVMLWRVKLGWSCSGCS